MILIPAHQALFRAIVTISKKENVVPYLVGGYVRDLFFSSNADIRDIDLTLEGDAPLFAKVCQRELGGELSVFNIFKTAKITAPSQCPEVDEIDFASCRSEIYENPGTLPTVKFSSISEDLTRRDFSINAMAINLADLCGQDEGTLEKLKAKIIDLYNGYEDLKEKKIRVLHAESFVDDPTRLYRAIRYKVRLNGSIESETENLFEKAVQNRALNTISTYRKFTEVKKMCSEPKAQDGLGFFEEKELLDFFPRKREVRKILEEVFGKEGDVYTNLLSTLFQDLSPEEQKKLAQDLNISKKYLQDLITL